MVATLPLLATFLDDVSETSPYRPASRLLWNEFYLDVNQGSGVAGVPFGTGPPGVVILSK